MSASMRLEGRVVIVPKSFGEYGRIAVISDPAGAVAAIVEPPAEGVE